MRWFEMMLNRVRSLFRGAEFERQMDEELDGIDRLHMEKIKEECRDARGVSFIENLMRDILHALRLAHRSPGFTAVAAGTLALGIGASTAIFSVADALLWK